MIPAHWTPRYLLDRSREWWFQKTNPQAPWLGPEAVKTLHRLLQPNMQGIECGAGRSTAWVAARVAALESWEENAEWLRRVEGQLRAQKIENVQLLPVPQQSETGWNYEERIKKTTIAAPDFALVDSEHHRDFLALHFAGKIKPGGFIMLDNANWFLPSASRSPHSLSIAEGPANDVWAAFLRQVKGWECRWTSSGVTDTAFFIRP